MNKYSSKAVKTAATVGMSLAMVLGNVAPVLAADVSTGGVADIITYGDTAKFAQDLLAEVLDAMPDYATAYKNTPVVEKENPKYVISAATSSEANDEKNATFVIATGEKLTTVMALSVEITDDGSYKNIKDGDSLVSIATFLANNSDLIDEADQDEDVIAFAKYVKGYSKATGAEKLGAYFENGNLKKFAGKMSDNPIYQVATGERDVEKNDVEIYNIIKDNEKYLNAVLKENAVVEGNNVEDMISDFVAEVADYKGEREDVYVKDYVNALEDVIVDGGTSSVYDAVEKEAVISYKNLGKVEKALKNIKNDDAVYGDKDSKLSSIAKYDDVKDAEEVAYYIDGLQAIIDDMKEVKDLLKSTNSDVKAYNKDLKSKVNKLGTAVKDYTAKSDDNTEKVLDIALNNFRESDITELKGFVEDFVGQFYTLTPKQLNSGKYVVRLENADYGRYVTTDDVFDLVDGTISTGLEYVLTTVIDNEESEDTYYDQLVNTVTTVEELLKAVTTDIEGLTLNSTLTSAQATKIIKAKKAMNQLVDKDGGIADEYASALTPKEKKEVLANEELVETLYFKLILNGSVTASGWVDKGNGDWDYINEDGTRSTKWVAAGSDWYYVKNGTMLRNSWIASDAQGTRWYYVDDAGKMVSNTTVNGYTFNSYGVWVK